MASSAAIGRLVFICPACNPCTSVVLASLSRTASPRRWFTHAEFKPARPVSFFLPRLPEAPCPDPTTTNTWSLPIWPAFPHQREYRRIGHASHHAYPELERQALISFWCVSRYFFETGAIRCNLSKKLKMMTTLSRAASVGFFAGDINKLPPARRPRRELRAFEMRDVYIYDEISRRQDIPGISNERRCTHHGTASVR
jgi:hypothetical protein